MDGSQMRTEDHPSPLSKKLAPPRSNWTALHPVERLCREEMPRRAEDRLGLEAEVVSVTLDYIGRSALVDLLAEDDLILLYAAASGPVGLVSSDAALLSALIEVQMLGRVLGTSREPRPPTTTDTVIARPMLSEWLSALEVHLPMPGEASLGSRVPDPRAARLTLDDGHFRVLTVTLALGGGKRQGRLMVACPEIVVSGDRRGPSQHALLRRHLERVETTLTGVLAELPVPLEEVRALREGDVLPLPLDATERMLLVAASGETVASARLGRLGPMRAVRVRPPELPRPEKKAAPPEAEPLDPLPEEETLSADQG